MLRTKLNSALGNLRIRTKISCAIVGMVLTMGLLSLFLVAPILEKQMQEHLDAMAVTAASNLASNATDSMLTENRLELQKLVDNFKANMNDIAYAFVLDKKNNVLAHTFPQGLPKQLFFVNVPQPTEKFRHQRLDTEVGYIHDIAVPVLKGEAGIIRVGISEDFVVMIISHVRRVFLITTIIFAGIAFLAALLLDSLITKPLKTLVLGTRDISQGDYHTRIVSSAERHDEIGILTKSFNQMATDIHDHLDRRQKTEKELRESEARLQAIFDHSAIGITVSDMEGKALSTNPAFQKMLGYRAKELSTKDFAELTHPEDVAAHKDEFDEMLAGRRDSFQMIKRYISKNNDIVWANTVISLGRDPHGKPLFVIGMVEDITVKKDLEAERLKSKKLESIGILAGGIAHDFNNLLTAILGNISLAKMLLPPESEVFQRLTTSEKACLRSQGLTKQLLTFAKGGAPITAEASAEELIKDSADFILSGSNVKCEYHLPESLWMIKVDTGQISQVIQNMINNAKQAMPEGGTIQVRAENVEIDNQSSLPLKTGEYVKIAIQDRGCGIETESLDKIFDPYFTTKNLGSGLGLTSCYSIVQSHSGHIQVNSTLGVGTTFHIYLPASSSAEKEKKEEISATTSQGTGHILLMDDEESIRDFVSTVLSHLGYTVTTAADGQEAIALYLQAQDSDTPINAIILDLTVPGGMGGLAALKEIRRTDPSVKAIVSSGYAHDPIMADYQSYGFMGVAPKPYMINDLCKIISEVLQS